MWPVRVPGDGERVEQVLPTLSPRLFLLITTAANDHSSLQFYKILLSILSPNMLRWHRTENYLIYYLQHQGNSI